MGLLPSMGRNFCAFGSVDWTLSKGTKQQTLELVDVDDEMFWTPKPAQSFLLAPGEIILPSRVQKTKRDPR